MKSDELLEKLGLMPFGLRTLTTYKCENCSCVFQTEMTSDEMKSEMREEFPDVDPEDVVVVCGDCYRKLQA